MLPFLFGSLSKLLTGKKPASRAERRAQTAKLKTRKLQCEVLEDRVTPTVDLFNHTTNTYIASFTGGGAIQDAIFDVEFNQLAGSTYRLNVNNDETYSDFVVSPNAKLNNLRIVRAPAATGAPQVLAAATGNNAWVRSAGVLIDGLDFQNSIAPNSNLTGIRIDASNIQINNSIISGFDTTSSTVGVRIVGGRSGTTIQNSTITGNYVGIAFTTGSGTNNTLIQNNFIQNSTTSGIEMVLGTTGTGTTVRHNQFSGNGGFNVNNLSTASIDASLNRWGTAGGLLTSESAVAATINGTSLVDFTPFLFYGDADGGTDGFQQDTSRVTVTTLGLQSGSTGRVQEGVSSIQNGTLTAGSRLVTALAGTYAENVIIDRALRLEGANVGISAGSSPGVRGTETIITSPVANLAGAGIGLVRVTSSNVTIDGLTLDGDNTGLAGGQAVIGGADSNARRGIVVAAQNALTSNVTLTNNRIRNFYGRGVQYGFSPTENGLLGWSTSVSSGTSSNNGFDGIGDTGLADGFVSLAFDSTPSFTGNAVIYTAYGPWYQFLYTDTTPVNVTNNTVATLGIGIGINETGGNNGLMTIGNNVFTLGIDGLGAQLWSVAHAAGTVFNNNTFTGTGGALSQGINAWTGTGAQSITFTGGSLSGFATGVYLANEEVYGPYGVATAANTLTFNNVNLSATVSGTIIHVLDTPVGTQPVQVNLVGSTMTGSSSGTGILLDGAAATLAGDTLNNTIFTAFTGTSQFMTLTNGAYNSPFAYVDGTGATYNGVLGSAASVAQGYAIEDKITHGTDAVGLGYVRITTARVYVTPSSGSIQRGVNVALPGDAVHVDAGTFIEDVSVNKAGLQLLGSGPGSTTISGAIGGTDGATVRIAANNVLVDGFTITREGNNTTDWNNPNLNFAGIAIQGTSITGAEIRNNSFYGNRTGIDINNSNGHSIHNNLIDFNRTGLIFRNQTNNISAYENFITNNWTVGVLFLDGSGGTNSPLQEALGSTFFNNNISGNWFGQIVDRQSGGSLPAPGTNVKNFSGNWYGTNSPVITTANSTEPGYAAQIPVVFGGSAAYVPGEPDILGPAVANFDISPYLDLGSDTSAAYGFQGDFSRLWVTSQLAQTGSTSRIQEAYNLLVDPVGPTDGVIRILGGTYPGDVTATAAKGADLIPGASPAQVIVGGNFTLDSSVELVMEINGTVPGTGYDQFAVTGDVTLGGASLSVTRDPNAFIPNGTAIRLIDNQGANAITNQFTGVPEGFVFTLNNVPFTASYVAGTGNDFALTVVAPTNVWVNDNWVITTDIGTVGLSAGDIVATGGGDIQPVIGKVFGYDAFSTIQTGVDAVALSGTVYVVSGLYPEQVNVNRSMFILGPQTGVDPRSGGITPRAGGEALVRTPDFLSSPSDGNLFTITADNVTIDGLTLDGNNTTSVTLGVPLSNGIQPHLARGIANGTDGGSWTPISGLNVSNNIIKNFARNGVMLNNGGVASGNNMITLNVIDNFQGYYTTPSSPTSFGGRQGVFLGNNSYASVVDNNITRTERGIHMQGHYLAAPGTPNITGNVITSATSGIYYNSQYQNATAAIISNNTLGSIGAFNAGMLIFTVQDTVAPTISNNTVSAGALFGYVVWTTPTAGGLTISGGSVTGATNSAVVLTNDITGYVGSPFSNQSARLNLSGITLTNNATGITVYDNPANGNPVNNLELSLNNVNVTGGTTGLTLDGANIALTGNSLGNTSFSGQSGQHVALTAGAYGSPFGYVDGTTASYNGVIGGSASLAQGFAIEDKIAHGTDAAGVGYVRITSGLVYVTPASGSIQRGINVASSGNTVHVNSGSYGEDIDMTVTPNITVSGQGAGTTTIVGQLGGSNNTVSLNSNQTIEGFTITRALGGGENNIGLAPNSGSTNVTVRNNTFTGNRTAIYVNGSGDQMNIYRNLIDNNRTGILFADTTHGAHQITENAVTNNRTFGLLFLPSITSISSGMTIFNNNVSGNYASQLENNSTAEVNASGNWWGVNNPTLFASSVNTIINSDPGTWAYPGPAVPPGSPFPYRLSGTGATLIDFSPYLDNGSDVAPATAGFQGDFSTLWVTPDGSQNGAPTYSRVQEGYDLTTAGGLVRILAGTYAGDVTTGVKAATLSPGTSPAIVTIGGNFTLSPTTTLAMELNGPAPGTGYDQFVVNGDVTLNNAILSATRTYGYIAGDNVILIVNNSANPTSGTFAGLPEGGPLVLTGIPFTATYAFNPTGNEVALQVLNQNPVWVDDNWTIAVDSDSSSSLTPGDIVDSAGGTVLGKIFGYNAFSTIQGGVNGVLTSGTVYVLSGTYDEAVNVNKSITLDGELDAAPAPILTRTVGAQQALVTVAATNVTVRDLELHVNRFFATGGIYASDTIADFSNIQLLNNVITSYGTGAGAGQNFVTPDGNTNAAGIVLLSFTTANLPVTVQGNTINAGPDPDGGGPLTASVFTRGIWLRRVVGSIGGAIPGQGNTVFANTQDLLVRFNDPSTTLVQNNTFLGAGMDISETNPGTGVINILDNQFVPVSSLFNQSLSIKYNYDNGRTINVDGNTFSGHGNIGIISGASKNVNITDNVFTPAAGSANFTHVLMSSSYPLNLLSTPAAITGNSISLTGNSFNDAAGASGRGIDFQNGNSIGSTFGSITVGGAGALANSFAVGLTEFMRLSPTPLAPLFNPANNPNPAPFSVNIDGTQNLYDVGSGLQLPAGMTLAQRFSLEDKILHKIDVGTTGFVTTVPGQVFVTPNSFLSPFTLAASIQRGIDAATSGDIVNLQAATYTENANQINPLGITYPGAAVLVNKPVTILGDGVVNVTKATAAIAGIPGFSIFDVSAPNVTFNNLNINVQRSQSSGGIQAFDNFSGLSVNNVTIRSFGTSGGISQASWLPGTSTYGIVVANISGGSPTVNITNTNVRPDNDITPTSFFGRAVYLQGVVSTVSGVLGTHAFIGLGQDFQITTAAPGVSSVSGMTFPAAGATVFGTQVGATVNLTGNVFDQPSAGLPGFPTKSLVIAENQDGSVNVTGNQFTNIQTDKIALISGRSKNVSVTGNTFSAATGATNFTYIVMSTAYPTSSHPLTSINDNSIAIQGNTFNGGSTVTGRAIDFQNGNSAGAGWGAITIGGATPAERNSFGANLGEFVRLSPTTITTPSFVNPATGPFTPNLNVSGNLFDLGSGLQLPASFSPAQNFAMENKVYHKIDNGTVGLVTWNANNIYVTPVVTATPTDNDYTRINNAIYAAGSGFAINLLGTFNWVEANAAASWATGSDYTASTYDDYSILVPANLNNVVFTGPLGLGTATIQGPGDLASVNLEQFLLFVTGTGPGAGYAFSTNSGWTISNLEIFDFDLSLGYFLDGGSQSPVAFSGTTIQNNTIRVPVDLNATVAPADVNQNIAIHLSIGTDQTITGNTLLFPDSNLAVSDTANNRFSTRVGIQGNTTGGASYDNLLITNNQLIVSGAQSADPERIRGIWENSHAHSSDITVSGNSFTNTSLGNDPTLNRQQAFWVTSHSSATTSVIYSGNTVSGANTGFKWLGDPEFPGTNFAGNLPVILTGNTITNTNTGILIQSNGSANINNSLASNTLSNTGAMAGVGTGIQIVAGSSATISGNNATISGFATGINVFGSATINNNTIHTNTTGIRFNSGASGSVTNNEFRDTASFLGNGTDLRLEVGAGALSAITGNTFGGGSGSPASFTSANGYFIDNRSSVAYDLTAAGNTWNRSNGSAWTALNTGTLADNFRIEDRIYGALDNAASGRITIVAGTRYVSTPGSGLNDETIQRAVDASDSGNTIHVEAGTYAENVIVDESVTIWGAGQGLTTVVPSFIGANMAGGSLPVGHSSIFLIRSNNVTIRNLTADGNNPSLISGIVVNGSDVDARNGIITDHVNILTPITGLNVQNVTVQNIWLRGIYASTTSGTFSFTNNIVTNVAGDPTASIGIFNFGGGGVISGNQVSQTIDGIASNWSTGTTFTGNTVTNSGSGIHTDNSGGPDVISGNTVQNGTAGSYGIFTFVPYSNITISNNIVNDVDVGLAAFGGNGGSTLFSGNQVDTNNRTGSLGAWVSTTMFIYGSSNVTATFTGNTIENSATLLLVEQENAMSAFITSPSSGPRVNHTEPARPASTGSNKKKDTGKKSSVRDNGPAFLLPPVVATVILNANTFDNTATSLTGTIGVDVNGGNLTINAGNQILGTQTGLRMSNAVTASTLVGSTLNNLIFSGVTGNYVTLTAGALDNTEVNGTAATYNGVLGSTATVPQGFAIEDKLQHAIDAATLGFIRIKTGNVFVTPNSFAASEGTTTPQIQRGVDAGVNNDTVWVQSGLYDNDVIINKSGMSVIGDGYATTTIRGVIGNGQPDTVLILSPNVTLAGFTITRTGNNLTQWNDTAPLTALNNQGVSIVSTGVVVRDNLVTGNRNGIYIDGGAGNVLIRNNIVNDNRTGIHTFQVNGLTITENDVSNNWTMGILFRNEQITNSTTGPIDIFNNSITGNYYAGIERRWNNTAVQINASGNWFGTNAPVYVSNNAGNAGEPGYSSIPLSVPIAFGGTAAPIPGAPDILESTGFGTQVDFTPFLWTGVDTNSGAYADANGFQGDFSNLGVTTVGAQVQPVSRIQEGYNLLPVTGGTLHVLAGTYAGNVTMGAKPTVIDIGAPNTSSQITINGSLTLTPATTVNFNLSGPSTSSPVGGVDYDQLVTTGATDLGGATFNITRSMGYFPNLGANFALVRSSVAKTGSFDYGGSVAENAIIAVDGVSFQVNYNLGSGPFDLNLGVTIPNGIVYVWDGWTGESIGDYYQPAPPVSTLAAPPGGYGTFSGTPVAFGYNAYATIQDAINAVGSGMTIRVYIGTYAQDITVPGGKNNLQLVAWGASGSRIINGVAGGPSATVTLNGTGTSILGNSGSDNFVVNQVAADNLAGIRTGVGSSGSTVSYVNVSGSVNTTAFVGVDVSSGSWVSYANGSISNYRTGIRVNTNAGTAANPVDVQNAVINGSGWASLTVMPAGVDVGLNGFARLTNGNVISGNRWGVRVLGGTAMLQGNDLSNNTHTGASAAGLLVANGGTVDAGQVIDGSEADYTGLGISTGGNLFTTGYGMGAAQAIVNLNADFIGAPTGTGNVTTGTHISARNNNFGTTVYGNVERIVNHAIDNNFQGYVDYRNAVGAVAPLQEGATDYYAEAPGEDLPNQRSMIRGMQFVIDSPVVIQTGAFTLTRRADANPSDYLYFYTSTLPQNASVPVTVTSSINGTTGRTTVNVTFTSPNTGAWNPGDVTEYGSLVDGNYFKTIDGSLVNLLFANSGVNYAGGAVTDEAFHRFYGDLNGDTVVDGVELGSSIDAIITNNSAYDKYFARTGGTSFNDNGIFDDVFARFLQAILPSAL